jgi:hypothetical protein
MPVPNLGGSTPEQERLWRTYLYWARSHLDPKTRSNSQLYIAKASNRLGQPTSEALQAVILTAVALEYRLRRTLESLNLSVRKRDGLGVLLDTFKGRLESAYCFDNGHPIRLPPEWRQVHRRLKHLVEARNRIVHGKHLDLLRELSNTRKARRRAASYFNALVDAMRIINEAIGRPAPSPPGARQYYKPLKLRAN